MTVNRYAEDQAETRRAGGAQAAEARRDGGGIAERRAFGARAVTGLRTREAGAGGHPWR